MTARWRNELGESAHSHVEAFERERIDLAQRRPVAPRNSARAAARPIGARATPEAFRLLSGADELGYGFNRESFVERGLCKAWWNPPAEARHL